MEMRKYIIDGRGKLTLDRIQHPPQTILFAICAKDISTQDWVELTYHTNYEEAERKFSEIVFAVTGEAPQKETND